MKTLMSGKISSLELNNWLRHYANYTPKSFNMPSAVRCNYSNVSKLQATLIIDVIYHLRLRSSHTDVMLLKRNSAAANSTFSEGETHYSTLLYKELPSKIRPSL